MPKAEGDTVRLDQKRVYANGGYRTEVRRLPNDVRLVTWMPMLFQLIWILAGAVVAFEGFHEGVIEGILFSTLVLGVWVGMMLLGYLQHIHFSKLQGRES